MAQAEKQIFIRTPQTTMYDLNDDVLRESFGHMDIEDLSVMADVSSTFRRVAREEFASRHKTVALMPWNGDYIGEVCITNSHWVSFFRKFGSVIASIRMDDRNPKHRVLLEAIPKYCGEALMELDLTRARWTNEMILDWRLSLSRLRKLKLRDCEFESGADESKMLSFCVELRSLTIWDSVGALNFGSPVALPKLNSLNLRFVKLTSRMISNGQPLLARVKQLVLDQCSFDAAADTLQILSYCVELNSLSLLYNYPMLSASRVALPQLKSLDVSLMHSGSYFAATLEHLLALNPQLEEIKLPCPSSRQIIEMVSQFVPNIVKLELGWSGNDGTIVDWKIFKNLKSLYIYFSNGAAKPVLKAVAEAGISLERLSISTSQNKDPYKPIDDFVEQISEFKSLREFELDHLHGLTLSDTLTIVRNLPNLSKLSLGGMDFSHAAISEIIKCGPQIQSLTYGTRSGDCVDNYLLINIRNAVVRHSEYRPFRLCIYHHAWRLLPKKLLNANFHILQFERY